jgi:hypothetical protein
MKGMNTLIKLFSLLLLMVIGIACSDYLDKDVHVDTTLDYQEIFTDVRLAPGFLNNIYTNIPDGFSRFGGAMLDAATDDAVCSDPGAAIQLFNKNAINATTNPDDVWDAMYRGIRKCNIFLREMDPVNGLIVLSNSIPEVRDGVRIRDYHKGEALFLRAFFHFELLKRYRQIFYIDQVIDPFDEASVFSFNQLSYDDAVEAIVADLDSAAVYLPATYPDDSFRGRPIRWTPLALKSRVLLYAASPLNNPDNDPEKWKRAADAARIVIDSRRYSLVSLTRIFNELYNNEMIFAVRAQNRNDIERFNYPVSFEGAGYMNPTEDLVAAFGMTANTYTGRMTGYVESDPYSLVTSKKREDRLRLSVFFNGARMRDTIVATFVGGKDGLFSTPTATKTGYYMSKFVDQNLDLSKSQTSMRAWIYMRYAEILLNYAEAMTEYDLDGNFTAIIRELDLLRNRANLRPFAVADRNLLRDIDEMRKYIKQERRLELAFEEHRFWDLRRWKDAEAVLNKPVKGMRVEWDDNAQTYIYSVFEADNRVFEPRMYWYPIPRKEILKYRNMGKTIQQNPGWED